MIQRLHANARLVRRREQRKTRAQAGAKNADSLVALLRQPTYRAPRVHHRLAADLHRSRDVRADDVVGAIQLGRLARVVIRQAEPQSADAEPSQQPAEAHMAVGSRVPLRQYHHSAMSVIVAHASEIDAVNGVVFGMRRVQCAWKRNRAAIGVRPVGVLRRIGRVEEAGAVFKNV